MFVRWVYGLIIPYSPTLWCHIFVHIFYEYSFLTYGCSLFHTPNISVTYFYLLHLFLQVFWVSQIVLHLPPLFICWRLYLSWLGWLCFGNTLVLHWLVLQWLWEQLIYSGFSLLLESWHYFSGILLVFMYFDIPVNLGRRWWSLFGNFSHVLSASPSLLQVLK